MKDYYQTLGVEKNVSQEDLKKAFRRLALKCHPDRNPDDKNAEERFKELNEAYSCLSDPAKRMNYDRFGTSEIPGLDQFGTGFGDIFDNIFGDFFGTFTGRGTQRRAQGEDLRYDIELTLEESAFGAERRIEVPRWDICFSCNGSGSKGKQSTTCTTCKGTGQVRFQQGFFNIARTCSKCRGQGHVIKDPCEVCSGEGKVRKFRTVSVNIPAGVDTGSRLRLQGEGELGAYGGPPGDLYIIIDVKEHLFFKREGLNIYCEMPLTFSQAMLGAEIEVPTLSGSQKLKIPSGTQPNEIFRLKGMGITKLGGRTKGDQIIAVTITIPKHLNERQRELIEEFAKIGGEDNLNNIKGFKDKIKGLFT